MSSFAVTIEEIEKIEPHPNADRLAIGKLVGQAYTFIVPKDVYHEGDLCIYFPVDSVIPNDIISKLGLEGKLHGANKNRVKTIKLRGIISQGLVAPYDLLTDYVSTLDLYEYTTGTDVTELLGVTKYEVDDTYVPNGKSSGRAGWLKPLPTHVYKYDIESYAKWAGLDMLNGHLYNQDVYISEKCEGSHLAFTVDTEGNFTVCQRNYAIDPEKIENHLWVKLASEYVAAAVAILDQINKGIDVVNTFNHQYPTYNNITFRGEVLGPGIQGNIYKLDKNELRFFEIEIDGKPIDSEDFLFITRIFNIPTVPLLFVGKLTTWLAGYGTDDLVETSNGQSILNQAVAREGIVIKAIREQYVNRFGRLVLKIRSPFYLAGSEL